MVFDGVRGDPRIIFQVALKTNTHAVVIAHKHLSGNPKPSLQNVLFAKKIEDIGKLFGIEVLDNVIVTQDEFYSYNSRENVAKL